MAARALHMNHVAAEEHVLEGEYGYGRLMDDLWAAGNRFVLLEHDVVAWPGAVERLLRCPRVWCVHEYPLGPGTVRWALGCVKVSGVLLGYRPGFSGVVWNQLDAAVVRELLAVCPGGPHVHDPPFAHVK